ncbi:MAG TPA: cyclase family protein [Syntrophales bacterium]|jgi:kynurenine formamidase|nr:cyclase family protein [Syntrophales bacterium]HON23498.1 cyclase family protein [Syntrophales bacterium]HOU78763.1 cyclase family protein [Syntrophales bacterium]HPC33387.1 cyclase family protein [Syntrophales bacterium]HQG34953.1 cyclase family protein [Syntrophales bacterium]
MNGKMQIIDLSVPTEESPSEALSLKVVRQSHRDTAPVLAGFFGCREEDLRDGLGYANDVVEMISHSGTHLDAPWHYAPVSEGKPARTIDQIPLEWCYSDGVVLDFRHKPKGSVIGSAELAQELARIGYVLKPYDIVLIMTGADKFWGRAEYFNAGCGMSREATLWLVDRGIRVMGIDSWGWDRPFWAIKEAFARTGDRSILWEAHLAGSEREYCHLEKLAHLDLIPRAFGFKVACFPVKLTGGSAGWCRAVALVEER